MIGRGCRVIRPFVKNPSNSEPPPVCKSVKNGTGSAHDTDRTKLQYTTRIKIDNRRSQKYKKTTHDLEKKNRRRTKKSRKALRKKSK